MTPRAMTRIEAPRTAAPAPGVPTAVLAGLHDLPGLVHACAVDTSADHERDVDGVARALVAWARRTDDVSADRERRVEDVIVTTPTAHHLVRALETTGGRPTVWVYLRVDRDSGNLAIARRRLAAVTRRPPPLLPAPRAAPSARPAGLAAVPTVEPPPLLPALPARAPAGRPADDGSTVRHRPPELARRWQRDPATLRRVLAGLRRLA